MKTHKLIGRNLDDGSEYHNPLTGQTTVYLASELGLRTDLASNGTVRHEPINGDDFDYNEDGIREDAIKKHAEKKPSASPNTRKKEIENWADLGYDEHTKERILSREASFSNDSFAAIAEAFHEQEEREEGIETWVDSTLNQDREPVPDQLTTLQVFRQNRSNINSK